MLNELMFLRLRWYALGVSLDDGVSYSKIKPEIKKLIKDSRLIIKKFKHQYCV